MFLDRFLHHARKVTEHTDQTGEHQAVVDLLVLTAYADHRVSQKELDELEAFDADHPSWDSGAFSVGQYLPQAFAKVRTAQDAPDGVETLLADAAGRLSTPEARREAVAACRHLVVADGSQPEETEFLTELQRRLGR